jgi:hypothetical protein
VPWLPWRRPLERGRSLGTPVAAAAMVAGWCAGGTTLSPAQVPVPAFAMEPRARGVPGCRLRRRWWLLERGWRVSSGAVGTAGTGPCLERAALPRGVRDWARRMPSGQCSAMLRASCVHLGLAGAVGVRRWRRRWRGEAAHLCKSGLGTWRARCASCCVARRGCIAAWLATETRAAARHGRPVQPGRSPTAFRRTTIAPSEPAIRQPTIPQCRARAQGGEGCRHARPGALAVPPCLSDDRESARSASPLTPLVSRTLGRRGTRASSMKCARPSEKGALAGYARGTAVQRDPAHGIARGVRPCALAEPQGGARPGCRAPVHLDAHGRASAPPAVCPPCAAPLQPARLSINVGWPSMQGGALTRGTMHREA